MLSPPSLLRPVCFFWFLNGVLLLSQSTNKQPSPKCFFFCPPRPQTRTKNHKSYKYIETTTSFSLFSAFFPPADYHLSNNVVNTTITFFLFSKFMTITFLLANFCNFYVCKFSLKFQQNVAKKKTTTITKLTKMLFSLTKLYSVVCSFIHTSVHLYIHSSIHPSLNTCIHRFTLTNVNMAIKHSLAKKPNQPTIEKKLWPLQEKKGLVLIYTPFFFLLPFLSVHLQGFFSKIKHYTKFTQKINIQTLVANC